MRKHLKNGDFWGFTFTMDIFSGFTFTMDIFSVSRAKIARCRGSLIQGSLVSVPSGFLSSFACFYVRKQLSN